MSGLCSIFSFLGRIEGFLARILNKIVIAESAIARVLTMPAMVLNIFSLLILVFILILMICAFFTKFLRWFGLDVTLDPLDWIPGRPIFFWIASIYRFAVNMSVLVAIFFGMAKIYEPMTKGADTLYTLFINILASLPWVYVFLGFIIGNGLVMGLYKMICKPNHTNLASFINIVDGSLYSIIIFAMFLMVFFRIVGCDSSITIHKVLLIGSLTYFIFKVFIFGSEYVISENLFYLLGNVDKASKTDCYATDDDDDDDNKNNVLLWVNRFLAVFIWPAIIGILLLQALPIAIAINGTIAGFLTKIVGKLIKVFLVGFGKKK